MLLVVAGGDEIVELGVADIALVVHHGEGELRQLVQFRIAQCAGVAQCFDQLGRHQVFLRAQRAVTGHAKAATIGDGGGDLHHFAFSRREAGFRIDRADFLVHFERGRGVGQYADQIR